MSSDSAMSDDDAMAADWAAALAEAKSSSPESSIVEQVAPASFTNFSPTTANEMALSTLGPFASRSAGTSRFAIPGGRGLPRATFLAMPGGSVFAVILCVAK